MNIMQKRGQGQSWSLDIILAVVIFVLVIAIFYALLGRNTTTNSKNLAVEANALTSTIDSSTGLNSSLTIIHNGKIEPQDLSQLYDQDYESVKSQFGIRGEFCIYVVDQYGKVVSVTTPSNDSKIGFGNSNYTINGQGCGNIIS